MFEVNLIFLSVQKLADMFVASVSKCIFFSFLQIVELMLSVVVLKWFCNVIHLWLSRNILVPWVEELTQYQFSTTRTM